MKTSKCFMVIFGCAALITVAVRTAGGNKIEDTLLGAGFMILISLSIAKELSNFN